MAATANIKAVITAEDRGSAVLGGFGSSVDSLGAKIGGAFKIAGVAAFAAVATGVIAATKASWDQVDAVQQATVGLKAYEKDGNKVNDVLSKLVAYARSDLGVLFNRKDLFDSAQSLKLMGDNTDDLVKHVEILSRSVGLGLSNWDELDLIVGRVGSTGRLTGDDFDNLTKAGFKLDPQIRNTNQNFQSLFDNLDKGIPVDALKGQSDTIEGKMIHLQTAFRGVGDAILGVNSDTGKFNPGGLGDEATKAITKITDALKNPEFKQGIKDTMAGIKQGFAVFRDVLKQVFIVMQPVFDYIKNNKEAWDVLKMSIIAIVVIIAGLIVVIGVGLVGAFAAIMAVINVAEAIVRYFTQQVHDLVNAIVAVVNWFGQLGNSIGSAMGQFINSVASGINSAIKWFQNLPGMIGNAIGNAGQWLYNVGKDIVNGLIRGINDVAGGIGKALSNASNDAVKQVKNILGIHSPSTVFAGIGENIGQGMVQGIESTMPAVNGAMNNLSPSNANWDTSQQSTTVVKQNTTPNITIQVGAFMGTQTDARKLAKMVFDSYQEIQAMGGTA